MLVEELMPKLWQHHPGLTLDIVGSNPTERVNELQGQGVEVVGFVPDPIERLSELGSTFTCCGAPGSS